MNAEELAKSLAARFLESGNYEALGTPLGREAALRYAQAASLDSLDYYFRPEEGFAGLAVHSVGFTPGADKEEVIIYVARGSRKMLNALPESVEGIPVRADLVGRLRAGPSMATSGVSHLFERNSRIACGSSCAPSNENYSGTLGALVSDGMRIFALSNNHVFAACNHTPVNMPILSPSTVDARPGRRAPGEICRYERMIELRSGDPSLVPLARLDAAIASVPDPQLVSSWQGDGNDGYDTPAVPSAPSAGLRVKKFGRTTGLTHGKIEAVVPTPWFLPYRSGKFNAVVWFTDTWTVRPIDNDPFGLGGDSGSLVVTEDGSSAIGLYFAGNNKGDFGIFAPIEDVLSAFGNLELVSGHGV
jgi:hypothetical protein